MIKALFFGSALACMLSVAAQDATAQSPKFFGSIWQWAGPAPAEFSALFNQTTPENAAQLAAYKRVFSLFWSHPSVRGVTLWGYKQGAIWQQDAYLVRSDGTERPALTWLKQYLSSSAVLSQPTHAEPGSPAFAPVNQTVSVRFTQHGIVAVDGTGKLFQVDGRRIPGGGRAPLR